MGYSHYNWRQFVLGIVSPAILVFILFMVAIFGFVTPTMETAIVDRKKEMIRELTVAAWGILAAYERQEHEGKLSREQAQQLALSEIRHLRYGSEGKDYFWITDLTPSMVMHPYRPELDGTNVSAYQDLHGEKVFVKFVNLARTQGEGYASYLWQWKDDPQRVEPKLSFVKLFEPWGWIIGTGVYLDDVHAEIARLTGRLTRISMGITVTLAALLLWIGRQSYLIERRRRQVEHELRESEAKYRLLVESAAEGILLVADQRVVFCNKAVLAVLGLEEPACRGRLLVELLVRDHAGSQAVAEWLNTGSGPARFEARFLNHEQKAVDVALAVAVVRVGGQPGLLLSLRESAGMLAPLAQPPYSALQASQAIGFFRASLKVSEPLLEASPGFLALTSAVTPADRARLTVLELIPDAAARRQVLRGLLSERQLLDQVLTLQRLDGRLITIRASAVLVADRDGRPLFCEGVVTDITGAHAAATLRDEAAAAQLGATLFFMTPVGDLAHLPQTCAMSTPVQAAAALMTRPQSDVVLVCGPDGEPAGMLTAVDLLARVLAPGVVPVPPAGELMTAPLVCVTPDTRVFQALHLMQEKGLHHLVVRQPEGAVTRVVTHRELLQLQEYSLPSLIQQVQAAETVADLQRLHARVPGAARLLVAAGARVAGITDYLSALCDAILQRLVALAQRDLGAAPTPFAILALGSEGRHEQTLATDQDNALVYADPPVGTEAAAAAYFQALAARVCDGLNAVGYNYCRGDVMASNPAWCRPLTQWRELFSNWVENSTPDALHGVNIVFDFRHAAGDATLAAELRAHVLKAVGSREAFFFNLARSTLEFKPPLGFFGKIVVESGGRHPETFDIKSGLVPIVNFARVYALRHSTPATGTLARLAQLAAAGVLQTASAAELCVAFETLSALRLRHQADQVADGVAPDNHLNPHTLTEIEQATLRKVFEQITVFQAKLRLEFTRTL